MIEFVKLAELRRPPSPYNQDLLAWRFQDKWSFDDTVTVLAWADDRGCVLHEANCAHAGGAEPTAKGRMDEARERFALERPNGTYRYFGFCGHCLVERIPNYGREPTPRELELLENLQARLEDMSNRDESTITADALISRMKLYGNLEVSRADIKFLLDFYRQSLGDEESDLSARVALNRRR